jgi:uncharacterized peroxidase-related enzyme
MVITTGRARIASAVGYCSPNSLPTSTREPCMNEIAPARFAPPPLESLPEDLRERIQAVQDKVGFVPNVFLTLARRPDEFRAFFAYHDALMEKDSGLSKGEREMIVVVTSALNQCLYCVVAHGAVVRIREKAPLLADQLAVNYRHAPISPRQRAMLDFAVKVAEGAQDLEEVDYEGLREHGFGDEDIWDIGAVSAFFALSNRLAHVTGMRPNEEFYDMGRAPLGRRPR